MAQENDCNLEQWEKKRFSTVIAFAVQSLFLGIEYSFTFLTLWPYIKLYVKPESPKVMYGIISACYLTSGIISSLILGRLVDKCRRVRCTMIVVNWFVIFGNIFYAIPFNILYLMFGRLIAGVGGLLRSVIIGEIARVYEPNELTSKYSIMGMTYSFGFIVGPAINFTFLSMSVKIGKIEVNCLNFPSIFIAMCFVLIQIGVFIFVHDLSKIHDKKKIHEELQQQQPLMDQSESSTTKSLNKASLLCQITKSIDITLLIFTSFCCTYFITSIEMWLPLIILDTLKWKLFELNVVIFGTGITCVLACFFLIRFPFSSKYSFIIAVTCLLCFAVMIGTLIVIVRYKSNLIVSVTNWVLFCILFGSQVIIEDVFLVACIAAMVSSRIQTFMDTVRLSASRIGALIALSTSALLYEWMAYVGCAYIFIITLNIFAFSYRRTSLVNPKTQIL